MSRQIGTARIGIDIGGTFTDFALEVDGRRHTVKVLTTPQAPERALLDGLQHLLADSGVTPEQVGLIIHGTTLATNALIERKGARTALITTAGFRDVLQSGYENRYEQYDLQIDLPTPLVPRHLRYTVPERMDAQGAVRLPLDLDALDAVIATLAAEHVEAVAIGLLHSYANPAHEVAIANRLAERLPGVAVTQSADVCAEMREYDRFSTACANAYVQPKIAAYLSALEEGLQQLGLSCPMLMMLSSGGLTTVAAARRFPVRLVESGPAGGAIFAASIARECGYDKVLSFDMGGTTAKICLIDNFEPQTSRGFEVARIYRFRKGSGLPLRIPVIEMVEIGAGGGSVARVDSMHRISVGPDSAGAEPGPACYGRGGSAATVTDADLVLGRIDPQAFAGGSVALQSDAATQALRRAIAAPLALSAEHAAFGVSEIVDENMANAARVHAIESGTHVGDRTLIAFGGAAPLHVGRVAAKLGVTTFVIPTGAGVGSAVGFLRAPVAYELARSDRRELASFDGAQVSALLDELGAQAQAVVEPAAFGMPLTRQRFVLMRYIGQGHEIQIEVPADLNLRDGGAALQQLFDHAYARVYSRVVPGQGVEVLSWIVRVVARSAAPVAGSHAEPATTAAPPHSHPIPDGTRRIFEAGAGMFIDAPLYQRAALRPGAEFAGPAIVLENETTTIIPPHYLVCVNRIGYLECTRMN